MSLFFLFLGFAVGAAFYVVAGRDIDAGGLDLPRRLGLVVAVGLVLGLAGLMFVKQSEQELQQAIERDRAERTRSAPAEPVTPPASSALAAGAEGAGTGASASRTESPGAVSSRAATQTATQTATQAANQAANQTTTRAEAQGPATAQAPAEPATGPAASPPSAAAEPTRPPASDPVSAPIRAPATAAPRDSDLQCAYSMDTDRCLCLTRDGARADVGYERCRALVAARED